MGATEWYENQHRLKCSDGTWKWILDRGRIIEWDKNGKPTRFTGTHTDIHRYKRYEFLIEQSLEEKEVLLHEIHHRVKNNLQIISSILNLQYPRLKYPELQEIFTDCKSRIQSIALVHEILYQHDDVSRISVASYMNALSSSVSSLYLNPEVNIIIKILPEDFALPIHSAIPIGIIVNEIMSNSFKHAFPDRQSGTIMCSVSNNGTYCVMEISNNGIAPDSDFDLEKYDTLGISLIRSLTEQLGGRIVLHRENGLSYSISFPL
jgi:two-component sensor histidine kinase